MNEAGVPAVPRVMIAEDEPKLAQLLVDYLQAAALSTVVVDDGLQVLPAIREQAPDLLLLDLMLPGRDGLSICQELRGFSHLPVIMVTARVEEVERLMGLEAGADDYICKPFRPREVVARVQAQLRRRQWDRGGESPATLAPAAGERLQLDETQMRALVAGRPLDLTPAEFRLLRHLTQAPGRVFSRDQLLDVLHEDGRVVTDRAVDSHVRNLRRKLEGMSADWDPIRSVYGVGYAWEEAG